MFEFINIMKFIATLLITNSHYTLIYPTQALCFGGLLGDVLFFYVSGFCLYNIKTNFFNWYLHRAVRIYPAVWIITTICILRGMYVIHYTPWYEFYFYPTYYHFIASILVLYIIYYFIVKFEFFKKRLPLLIAIITGAYLIYYFCFFDYNNINFDSVELKHTRFLYLISMLIGAYQRRNIDKLRKLNNKWIYGVAAVVFGGLYLSFNAFVLKKNVYQLTSQILLIGFLCFFAIFLLLYEDKLKNINIYVKKFISKIASVTLEVYVLQYLMIDIVCKYVKIFPLNWVCLTLAIFTSAIILNYLDSYIYKGFCKVFDKIFKKESGNGSSLRKRKTKE